MAPRPSPVGRRPTCRATVRDVPFSGDAAPTLIVAFWAVVAAVDAYWIFVLGQQLPTV